MESNTNQIKKLPYSITKSQLIKMCSPFPEYTILKRINTIIYDNRKNRTENTLKTFTQIVRSKYIECEEIKEYFKTFGLPDGYEL